MGNCKDCKYWRGAFTGDKMCTAPMYIQYSKNGMSLSSLGAENNGVTVLLTGPYFGCVLFEQKESE